MEPHTIFLLGKPGSGKGTQAKLLSEKTGWRIISASQEIRAIAQDENAFGHKLKNTMDSGALTPSWVPNYIFLKVIFGLSENESIIFDGFNRMAPEAQVNTEALTWIGRPFTAVFLKVSDDTVRQRIELRKQLENRADDHAVDTRLGVYYSQTEATIEFFRGLGKLIEINGEETPEEIARDIQSALGL